MSVDAAETVAPLRWAPVLPIVGEFSDCLNEQMTPLRLEHVNDRTWSQERYLAMRATGIYEAIGVYLHFSADGTLLYVGMTMSGFDRFWKSRPDDARFTDVIRVPRQLSFLVPALERFLIDRLRPRDNVR